MHKAKTVSKRKSPLRTEPLRVPGQAADRALNDYLLDHLLLPALMAAVLVALAAIEWFRALYPQPPIPWLYTLVAVLGVLWAAWSIRKGWVGGKQLKQGRDGERYVATYLENLRQFGFYVYHDIPTGDANIDHVLIGSRGIFTIETKTLSKPVRGECKIRVAADGISVNGILLDRNPLVQAKAQAGWLRAFFGDADFKVAVRPVILFPGWFVEPFDINAVGAWILEPKALEGYVSNQRDSIPPEQAKAMAAALASYVRANAKL